MAVKEKKVFPFSDFRGLDRESKPLKVHPSRATSGVNFQIDSGTLKTRPAVKFKRAPSFELEPNDYIIDWYIFRNVIIYITKKHIYIENEETHEFFNEKEDGNENFIHPYFSDFNFEGLTPVFQEEKKVLFIFGLKYIFVFSILSNGDIVLYDLGKNKPVNPYGSDSTVLHKEYDDLPVPYEPTIFIGGNRYEDVNLLSGVTKYKLFASTKDFDDEGQILYKLPTHYSREKHRGCIEEVKIYNNKFSDFKVIPVFLGRVGEEIEKEEDLAVYGESYSNYGSGGDCFEIKNVFYPENDFEYLRNNANEESIVSEILNLDKNTFFNFREKDSDQNVFEFLLNIIITEGTNFNTNHIVKFKLPVRNKVIYRDESTNFIIESKMKSFEFPIYVQLKKYDNYEIKLENGTLYQSSIMKKEKSVATYPNYPAVPDGTYEKVITLFDEPYKMEEIDTDAFKSIAEVFLLQNRNEYVDGEKLRINARLFKEYQEEQSQEVAIIWQDEYNEPNHYESATYDLSNPPDPNEFPDYPTFPNPEHYPVVEITVPIEGMGTQVDVPGDSVLRQRILEKVIENLYSFPLLGDAGKAFVKVKLFVRNPDGQGGYFPKGISAVFPFEYSKAKTIYWEDRMAVSYVVTINKELGAEINPGLYKFSFNENEQIFELRIKDYFFDYNNEPSIEVKISFSENPDYKLISDCKFGITFGSENRLFLAGNPEFPNIDRYNVSNDLLSDLEGNQSYELAYFPSKNRRVVGGRGAINGYVVATDSQLYVTKEEYPNDQKFFIRERILTEEGIVGYKEHKTSINHTPLNHRCIFRFYNDILMLTKDGLFGIEISGNILTNERLIKLRSSLVNEDLVESIKTYDYKKIYVAENNQMMYIFIGKTVYVADNRYIFKKDNDPYETVNYEMLKWEIPIEQRYAKFINNDFYLLSGDGKIFYNFVEDSNDDDAYKFKEAFGVLFGFAFYNSYDIDEIINKYSIVRFVFPEIYGSFAKKGSDYSFSSGIVNINVGVSLAFANLNDGDKIYLKKEAGMVKGFTVSGFEESGRTSFTLLDYDSDYNTDYLYLDYSNKPLYLSCFLDIYDGTTGFTLKPYYVGNYGKYVIENLDDLEEFGNTETQFVFGEVGMQDCLMICEIPIQFVWVSCITDFNNNLYEKTMFRGNVYATKHIKENNLYLGYRTMRRLKPLDEVIPMPNNFDFNEFNFDLFSFSTFSEFGMSLPLKENNFLYIQFLIRGEGRLQINALEIIYKLNRNLKSIG